MNTKKLFTKKSTKITSAILTLAILSVLMLSGPAKAITLGFNNLPDSANEGSSVTFEGLVDIHSNDRVPLTNVTVLIKNNGNVKDSCTFQLTTGGSCNNLDIAVKESRTNRKNNSGTGYGYGYNYSGDYRFINESFGYGFSNVTGYGYNSFQSNVGTDAEFVYDITWSTPSVSSDTTYSVELKAEATDGSNSAVYKTKGAETIKIKASSSGGSSGGSSTETYTPSQTEIEQGYTQTLSTGDEVGFTSGSGSGEYHFLEINDVYDDSATMTVHSNTFTNTLDVGEDWELDLDSDSVKDFKITLNSIIDDSVNVTMTSITKSITQPSDDEEETDEGTGEEQTEEEQTGEEEQTDEEETGTGEDTQEEETKEEEEETTGQGMTTQAIAVLGVIVVLAIIIAIVATRRKR